MDDKGGLWHILYEDKNDKGAAQEVLTVWFIGSSMKVSF